MSYKFNQEWLDQILPCLEQDGVKNSHELIHQWEELGAKGVDLIVALVGTKAPYEGIKILNRKTGEYYYKSPKL